ncbi:MAG: Asp-tRNA(Asn)/Glu-tRNA(Gln) amidotransferase subunit GatC [Firmicutes bacterium]|nr:Asp-tRNA(Asn)/Glu-tRNA(Gln) amidotransferase subunit GatC [Bacillota bacterium]
MTESKFISRADVEHVAKLAHLSFNEEETADCIDKLGSILEYMQELHGIDTQGVPATTHVLDLQNVLREDVPGETLPREQALANAPETAEGKFFRVPRII